MATTQNNAFLIMIFHSPEDKAAELLLGWNHNTRISTHTFFVAYNLANYLTVSWRMDPKAGLLFRKSPWQQVTCRAYRSAIWADLHNIFLAHSTTVYIDFHWLLFLFKSCRITFFFSRDLNFYLYQWAYWSSFHVFISHKMICFYIFLLHQFSIFHYFE